MIERIIEEIKEILEDPKIELSKDTSLIGDNSPMDSMNIQSLYQTRRLVRIWDLYLIGLVKPCLSQKYVSFY